MCTTVLCFDCAYINSLFSSDFKNAGELLYSLGNYYVVKYRNYDLMKKYYLMAINKGNPDAMNSLGYHYYGHEKNYNLMKKYFLIYYKYFKEKYYITNKINIRIMYKIYIVYNYNNL